MPRITPFARSGTVLASGLASAGRQGGRPSGPRSSLRHGALTTVPLGTWRCHMLAGVRRKLAMGKRVWDFFQAQPGSEARRLEVLRQLEERLSRTHTLPVQ